MIIFEIVNDQTGTKTLGNYRWSVMINFNDPIAKGVIKGFPREQQTAKDLVKLAMADWERQDEDLLRGGAGKPRRAQTRSSRG